MGFRVLSARHPLTPELNLGVHSQRLSASEDLLVTQRVPLRPQDWRALCWVKVRVQF